MRCKRYLRGLTALTCGACLLQVGGCTIDSLLQDILNIAISAILTQLLSTPVI